MVEDFREVPVLVDGGHAEGEAGDDAEDGGYGGAELELEAEDEDCGSEEGGGGVDVGAEDAGDLSEEDVADGAASYSGDPPRRMARKVPPSTSALPDGSSDRFR